MNSWNDLDQLQSRGSQQGKVGSLGALHKHREITLSQFFTPAWLVRFIWDTVKPAFSNEHQYSLLDNSIGAASMFRYASPEQFSINGFDIDESLVSDVSKILDHSGFDIDIRHASLEQVELSTYSVGLINPAFSIPLAAPTLSRYEGVTHYGIHGPDTSAVSHEYALAQALAHCDMVAAIVPRSTVDKLKEMGKAFSRLRAIYTLPADTFKDENVKSVSTSLLIFGRELKASKAKVPETVRVKRRTLNQTSSPEPLFQLVCRSKNEMHTKPIRTLGIDESTPAVTLAPTTDKRVILTRRGRTIKLKFFDGATEAKVKNALYRERLLSTRHHRYPAETLYRGQFQLNLDVLALQDDPYTALEQVLNTIRSGGGEPEITAGLSNGLKAVIKEHQKMTVPYGRTVYRKGTPAFKATARKMALLNRHQKGAVVGLGDTVTATRTDNGFSVKTARGCFDCDHDHFFALFEVEDTALDAGYWEEIAPPIKATYPQQIKQLEAKAKKLGLDQWLTWDFQQEDLLELAFRPHGAICGWQMALGKSRLALALSLLLNGPSLIVVKSRLVDEMTRELTALGLNDSQFKVLRTLNDVHQLRKINIVSYEVLKRPRCPKFPTITLARHLKGRISNVIADEGGLLANTDSQQTQSLWDLGAKRRYIFDGTPCPNYPREMLALASWAIGEERSYQPYSLKAGYINKGLFADAFEQPTGRQAFLDHFVQFEWTTNEFLDTGKGAKREVPKIKQHNLGLFRSWISPMIKRRVQQEPAVQRHVKFPVPTLHEPTTIDWDFDHLYLYIEAVEDFAAWYKDYVKAQHLNEKGLNLTLILARLEACFKAANVPSQVSGFSTTPIQGLTAKERATIDMVVDEVNKGRRPIVFARNPVVLNRLSKELDTHGISNLVFTGQETIDKRTKRLNEQVREGDTQVMLASLGVTQDGLNLHQLNTFIFYNRSYKAREEFQAIYRLIRPQQKSDVYGHFLHLAGSIDEYMGQLIEWKALASEAGFDYGDQPDDEDFTHFDAFIYRFLESLPTLKEKLKIARQNRAA